MKKIKITFIGGDMRQISAAGYFAEKGHTARAFGFDGMKGGDFGVELCEFLPQATEDADCIVLPLPYMAGGKINCPMTKAEISLPDVLENSYQAIILGGKLDKKAYDAARAHNNKIIDYYEREELSVLNSVPTAEGAIEIAMRELPVTIFGAEVAVIGYGRVGKVLAKTLRALGAEVAVFARSPAARAWAKTDGCRAYDIARLSELAGSFICIFNTVPAPVIDSGVIAGINKSALVIDLASSPGGVDFGAAEKAGIKTVQALSLPGRVAPDTAGKIIAETIENILVQEGIL